MVDGGGMLLKSGSGPSSPPLLSPQSPLGPGGGHTFLLSLHIEVHHVLVKLKYVKQNQYASMCQCHIYKVVNRFSSRTDTVSLCALIFSMRLRLHNNFEVTHYIIIHKDNLRKKNISIQVAPISKCSGCILHSPQLHS